MRMCNTCVRPLCDYCQFATNERKFTGHCTRHNKPVKADDHCDEFSCFNLPPVRDGDGTDSVLVGSVPDVRISD